MHSRVCHSTAAFVCNAQMEAHGWVQHYGVPDLTGLPAAANCSESPAWAGPAPHTALDQPVKSACCTGTTSQVCMMHRDNQ